MKTPIAIAGALLCAAQPLLAQPMHQPGPPLLGGPMRHDLLFTAGAQLEQERIVAGAPYCADAVHETVQPLADGNRIVQRQTSRQCRDGQGRTRQEITTSDGRSRVYLRDPVAHEAWMLDGDRKLAVRLDAPRMALGAAGEPHIWEKLVVWGHGMGERVRNTFRPAPELPAAPPIPSVPPMPPAEPAAPPIPPVPPMPPAEPAAPHAMAGLPPPIALHARLLGPRGQGTTTLLPAETMEGLRADGKRTVWTIEAGRIGNEKPITIVNEVWSSPELGITLRSRDSDPVVGEATFRVQNVARGEPDAQLFKVPAEFSKVSPPVATARPKP